MSKEFSQSRTNFGSKLNSWPIRLLRLSTVWPEGYVSAADYRPDENKATVPHLAPEIKCSKKQ